MIVQRICGLLDEDRISREIDEPITHAYLTFNPRKRGPFSAKTFHEELSRFVHHLYRNALRFEQELTPPQALAEAIAILETGYQSEKSRGYIAAYRDASNPYFDGIQLVVWQMTQVVKVREREKYTQWVYASQVDPFDWQTKCRLAEYLMNRFTPSPLISFLQCPPSQLADNWQDLLPAPVEPDNAPHLTSDISDVF
ncbi:MAG: hypothetical protein V2A74_08400 [bacterium]